jgi:hypothetical protein
MDWVIIFVCTDSTCSTEYQILNWGNGGPDSNTNVGAAGYTPAEADNEPIPAGVLWASGPFQTGVAIDIDALVPDGPYQYIRIYAPLAGDNDPMQVDAIEILP